MVIKEKRDQIAEQNEEALVFDNPSFDGAIIGVTDDGRAVYSYYRMVEELAADEDMSEEDARDFVEFNTLRAVPYMHGDAPVIVFEIT